MKRVSHTLTALTGKLFCQTLKEVVFRRALETAADHELTDVQYFCLRFLYLHREASIGAVAEGLGISDAASTKLVNRLVIKGLVDRREDPKDRRVLQLSLTEAGETLTRKVREKEDEQFATIIGRMSPEDQRKLHDGLASFLAAALTEKEQVDRVCLRCGWMHDDECPGNQVYREIVGHNKTKV